MRVSRIWSNYKALYFLKFVLFSYFRKPNKHMLKFLRQKFVCSVVLATEIEQVLI